LAICGAIDKYGIDSFNLYILETLDFADSSILDQREFLSQKEGFWYNKILPSYNIQKILQPFTGPNHYRYGTKLSENVKLKISQSLIGRKVPENTKINYIKGARKKPVFCYDYYSNKLLIKFDGVRIAARALNLKNYQYISYRLDKDKPVDIKLEDINYKVYFKSK